MHFRMGLSWAALSLLGCLTTLGQSFVNWETPHVSPLAQTPDGQRLLAVNTADNRLEVFRLLAGQPVWEQSIAVGLDPVSVRALDSRMAWIVNHVSDSISIADLKTGHVVRTLATGDEPTDVVFAGDRAFVTCSQLNQVRVFDLSGLDAPPTIIPLQGEDPRALAVSPDGARVYVAIFESGNGTTILEHEVVSSALSPYGPGVNPPPNLGDTFDPPLNPTLPPAPKVALIVRKDPLSGAWLDDNFQDWSAAVPWDLHDHDLAVVDANTLDVSYVSTLMNLNMHLGVRPDGVVTVVGTEATNEIRFEPNVTGRFVHSVLAWVDVASGAKEIVDLNPHLADAYALHLPRVEPELRSRSLADPRGIVWNAAGTLAYVTGLGSNNVALIAADGHRSAIAGGQIEVGQGPTGLALNEAQQRLYVLNKFDASISVIETVDHTELLRVGFYDPTPAPVRDGRPLLYDAVRTSGLGVTACASCHVDARMDQVAWDLGDPSGALKPFNQVCQTALGGECEDFHPLKGPMTTQTLQGIVGVEPLHWRGDREGLEAFNPAFVGLLGDDVELTPDEMEAFKDFIATIKFPPNPFRNLDNSLPAMIGDGRPNTGRNLFLNSRLDGGVLTCNQCHAVPNGTNTQITPAGPMLAEQSVKIAHLRNLYEKTGFDKDSSENNRGFGFVHDGGKANLIEFLRFARFTFLPGQNGEQQRRDIAAFLLTFAQDTHAGVGAQLTLDGVNGTDPDVNTRLNTFIALANGLQVGLIVHGRQDGLPRGWVYTGANLFQSDRADEAASLNQLRAAAAAGSELTFTLVPFAARERMGVDRDEDGFFDRDEIEQCGDPQDPLIGPGHFVVCDANCDGAVDALDIQPFVLAISNRDAYALHFSACNPACNTDANGDGFTDVFDIVAFLECLGAP